MLKKPYGMYRMCINSRNSKTNLKNHIYPMPIVDNLLKRAPNYKIFPTLDLTNA
jgi:hypothetical protein